jgi:rhodanese-related sulfurtransferase
VEDLKQQIDDGTDVFIVDIRDKDEYDYDHIEGAASVPMNNMFKWGWLPKYSLDREIVIYCYWEISQIDSAQVATYLIGNGYTNVKILKGGYKTWKDMNYPIAGHSVNNAQTAENSTMVGK